MALKNRIDQLIKDEWNKAPSTDAQTTQIHSGVKFKAFTPERNSAIPAKHWVETYAPSNCDKYEYYRYVWMEGQKLRHRHIPGGNINSPTSRAARLFVLCAIASGKSPTEIVQLIISSTRR